MAESERRKIMVKHGTIVNLSSLPLQMLAFTASVVKSCLILAQLYRTILTMDCSNQIIYAQIDKNAQILYKSQSIKGQMHQ